MKKLAILTIGLALGAVGAYAQGTISFANDGSSLVKSNGVAVPVGSAHVQMFYQPGMNAAPAAFYSSGAINAGAWEAFPGGTQVAGISPIAGRFNGSTDTTGTDVAAGGSVWIEVVGWSGSAANFATAFGQGAAVGASSVLELVAGNGSTIPTPLLPANGFTGFSLATVTSSPEPTTLALGGLGAAALLFFRRKK